MTAVASVLSIVAAMVLFVFLPRMRTNMFQSGFGATNAVAGFSDQIELGAIGRIRSDHTVVLRVTTLEGEPPNDGVTVAEITEEGVILAFENYLIEIPVVAQWQ
jgi:hypothetical protein